MQILSVAPSFSMFLNQQLYSRRTNSFGLWLKILIVTFLAGSTKCEGLEKSGETPYGTEFQCYLQQQSHLVI